MRKRWIPGLSGRKGVVTRLAHIYVLLTGCATTHWVLWVSSAVKEDGRRHEVELARMTSSLACWSKLWNTFFFRSTFSGTHSYK